MEAKRIKLMGDKVHVNLAAIQSSSLGQVVYRIHFNDDLYGLAPGPTGYIFNGGQHTLSLNGYCSDVIAFLQLVIDNFADALKTLTGRRRYGEGIDEIKSIIAYVQIAERGIARRFNQY